MLFVKIYVQVKYNINIVSLDKVKREVKILNIMKGFPYIVEFRECVIDPATRTPSLIFDYIPHHELAVDYLKNSNQYDFKKFIIQILLV